MERGQCLSVILHAGISKSQCESIYQAIKEATSERLIMKLLEQRAPQKKYPRVIKVCKPELGEIFFGLALASADVL